MKILIIGAKGMLGQELVRVFSGDGEVFAWDRKDIDITNERNVAERIASALPDIIVNAAAYNAVDLADNEPGVANAVNGYAVGYLAKAAALCGAAFVHYSSDYVFGGTQEGGYAEHAKPDPINAYGYSKLFGEQALQSVVVNSSELRWYCIRLSRLFGSAGISKCAKQSFLAAIWKKAEASHRLEIIDAEVSSPTYAPDLARATREILLSGAYLGGKGYASGIYHRTNDGACTWYEFAKAMLGLIGWDGELVAVPAGRFTRTAKRPSASILKTTKLKPLRKWEEALFAYIKEGHA